MLRLDNPPVLAQPGVSYSHGIEVPPGARFFYTAGQVGRTPEGIIPEGIAAQTEQAWENLVNVLKSAAMAIEDLVKLTMILGDREDVAAFRAVHERFLGSARPELLVEIEAVATRA